MSNPISLLLSAGTRGRNARIGDIVLSSIVEVPNTGGLTLSAQAQCDGVAVNASRSVLLLMDGDDLIMRGNDIRTAELRRWRKPPVLSCTA